MFSKNELSNITLTLAVADIFQTDVCFYMYHQDIHHNYLKLNIKYKVLLFFFKMDKKCMKLNLLVDIKMLLC